MEHTLALIEKAHEGDKAARDQLVMDNVGLIWSIVRRFSGRGGDGGSVPDREHWAVEGD